jgi:hypothetical protein
MILDRILCPTYRPMLPIEHARVRYFGDVMNLLLLTALTGCAPQDATVSGDWFAWLAANSSATVENNTLDFDGATAFECSGKKGWDPEVCDFEPGYIGPPNGIKDNYIGGDCPMYNAEENFNPDDGPCNVSYGSQCNEKTLEDFAEQCAELQTLENNTWIVDDGYYGLTGDIEPWRTEALLNSEGDLQLTVHIDLGEGEDFRFGFAVDPDFAPIDCLEDENGDAYVAHRDGSNWIDEWSEDEDGNRIYYLNTGAYQHNPFKGADTWYLSDDMLSGYGFSKFSSEELSSVPANYGFYPDDIEEPEMSASFLAVDDHEMPNLSDYDARVEELCERTVGAACTHLSVDNDGDGASENDGDCDDADAEVLPADCPDTVDIPMSWADEFVTVLGAAKNGEARFEHKIESNKWRPIDSTISGLDGWMEVHSSWVRLEGGQTIADGENVKGDFQVLFKGEEGGSRVLVRGEFDIEALREDRWGYEILENAKRSENGTEFCGGATL